MRENADRLCCDLLRPTHMEDREVADDGVERRVRERQLLDVPALEAGRRYATPRDLEHRVRHIDADDVRPARDRPPGHVAWPSRQVEQARAAPGLGHVEEGLDHAAGDRCEELVVSGGGALPAGCLEGIESVGVDRHHRT